MTEQALAYSIDLSVLQDGPIKLFQADVAVYDAGEQVVFEGRTLLGAPDEETAYNSVDRVYMVDQRRNNPYVLGDLVLDWEIPEEPEYDPDEWDDDEPIDDEEGDPID